MNTATFDLHQLSSTTTTPKRAAAKVSPAKTKAKITPKAKPHWTVNLFKRTEALGDLYRAEGVTL